LGLEELRAGHEAVFDVVSVVELAGFAFAGAKPAGVAQPSDRGWRGERGSSPWYWIT